MSRRGWSVEICQDGDKAVDEYVRLEPELVFLTLDLPTMDGHIAALEMRETDPKARIIFVSSKTRLSKTQDAAYSSGAVLTLVTPVAFSDIDEKWGEIMGDIPEAPGLPDLDALYPELEEPEPVLPPQTKIGDKVRLHPGGKESSIASIVTWEGELQQASVGQSVTITLNDEIDVSRGDTIAVSTDP